MLEHLNGLLCDEIIENDRQIDIDITLKGLNLASFLLASIARGKDDDLKEAAIDGMEALVSAITYLGLMHQTVEQLKGLEGENLCA